MSMSSSFIRGMWLACVLASLSQAEEAREMLPLVKWQFVAETTKPAVLVVPTDATWQEVTVPHVFRQSSLPDNAVGWYRQNFTLQENERNRRVFLVLEGAATVKDVFINGKPVGQHRGVFTASVFDLSSGLLYGKDNVLDVRVTNADDEVRACLARSTLYHVNGGMFRKAWLVKTGMVHFFPELGSSGVTLLPENIQKSEADLKVRAMVRNPLSEPVEITLKYAVTTPGDGKGPSWETRQTVAPGEPVPVISSAKISDLKLWDLGQPNLYPVRVELWVNGAMSDVVTETTGFRTIKFQDKRFLLNGREVQFRGMNKHEQSEKAWNAVGDSGTDFEWRWLKELGVNAVRLAHYPHSHFEYGLADRAGVAVWAENAFAGQNWKGAWDEDKVPTPDGERLTRELVWQNRNHPSILFWSCGNETVTETAGHYAEILRAEDNSRVITYATNKEDPKNCDFVAKNTYHGWYGGHYTGFGAMPQNALISETGAGSWVSHHVPYGTIQWKVDKFEPEEYAELFTEYRCESIFKNDVAGHPLFFWWTFHEFYDRKFKNNRNAKGLLTMAGKPKDLYYLFQSFLRTDKPVVHLCGQNHFFRRFAPDNGIKAYANTPQLELVLNGVSQGKLKNGDYRQPDSEKKEKDGTKSVITGQSVHNTFFWKTPLRPGRNDVVVRDGEGHEDQAVIYQSATDGSVPEEETGLVMDLKSSNPLTRAVWINRPVEDQAPFYSEVDGSSDNTWDGIPAECAGASWISTGRLSDPALKSDLSFRLRPGSLGATVWVMASAGEYPIVTLKPRDEKMAETAARLRESLLKSGFQASPDKAIWRDHEFNLAQAVLYRREMASGETLRLPGETLDYVVLIREGK